MVIKYPPKIKARVNEIYFLILLFGVSISGNSVARMLKKTRKINKKILLINTFLIKKLAKTITKIKSKIRCIFQEGMNIIKVYIKYY